MLIDYLMDKSKERDATGEDKSLAFSRAQSKMEKPIEQIDVYEF